MKYKALGNFSHGSANGEISAKTGDILDLDETSAEALQAKGLVEQASVVGESIPLPVNGGEDSSAGESGSQEQSSEESEANEDGEEASHGSSGKKHKKRR